MTDILRIARLAATGAKIYNHSQRLQRGELESLDYLLRQAPYETIDAYRPGAGEVARSAVDYAYQTWQMLTGQDRVIDGEYRVLDGPPWADALRHIPAMQFGATIILGPIGGGKSKTGLRLADIWRPRTGYDVEVVAGYRSDYPDWAKPISMKTVVARARLLSRYLDEQGVTEDDRELFEKLGMGPKEKDRDKPTFRVTQSDLRRASHKIYIIEESSISMGSMSSVGKTTARDAAQILAMHCRHEEFRSLVIYIGQLMRQIAAPLRTNAMLLFKEPGGEEMDFDDPNDGAVKRLWREAAMAFEANKGSPYYHDYPRKSWCYCRAPGLGGHGFSGMIPFKLPGADDVIEAEYEDEE